MKALANGARDGKAKAAAAMRAGAEEMRVGAASAMRDNGVGEVVRAPSPWWGRPPRKLQNGDPYRVLVQRLDKAERFIGKIPPLADYLVRSISDIRSCLPIGTLPMLALGALAHEPARTYSIKELGAVLEKKWGLGTDAQTLRSSVEELIVGGFVVDKIGTSIRGGAATGKLCISPAGQQFLSDDEAWTPLQKALSTVNEPQRQMLISSFTPEGYPPLARGIAMTPAAQVYTALAGVGDTVEPLSSHIDAVPASISGLLAIVNHLPGGQRAVYEKIFGCRLNEILPDLVRKGWLEHRGDRWQVSSNGKTLVMEIDRDPGGSPHADPTTKQLSKLSPEVRSAVVGSVAEIADRMVSGSVN